MAHLLRTPVSSLRFPELPFRFAELVFGLGVEPVGASGALTCWFCGTSWMAEGANGLWLVKGTKLTLTVKVVDV